MGDQRERSGGEDLQGAGGGSRYGAEHGRVHIGLAELPGRFRRVGRSEVLVFSTIVCGEGMGARLVHSDTRDKHRDRRSALREAHTCWS